MTTDATTTGPGEALRPHAEDAFAGELRALAAADDRPRPERWRLSPWAIATYLLGGTLPDGTVITPKYVGPRRIVEVAVTTLATDRALLLLGVPGTAKTWVSEHLAAAVSGDSTLLVQGTAGTPEEAIRYGWNYARLLAHGPSREALVPSPVMRAMAEGMTARVEELTRIPADVQDTLITVLSEKTLPIPELGQEVQAVRGFNLIATANDRDRGVNELSSALRRRFNTVVLPLPATAEAVPLVAEPYRGVGPGGHGVVDHHPVDRTPGALVIAVVRAPTAVLPDLQSFVAQCLQQAGGAQRRCHRRYSSRSSAGSRRPGPRAGVVHRPPFADPFAVLRRRGTPHRAVRLRMRFGS
ncbi:AAA family ATPase [Streptomyces sp. MNU89]|uniref:ATP-binding protein n=1 Tax=Streptomyces sp. MNU89 TaxID=2560025 RepID=UPI001E5D2F68|nr:AAA family ATPase [Streptomyces sp. MNU89]MCC9739863.1 AAA family ATPase [Streptomyces sp. MNU89]